MNSRREFLGHAFMGCFAGVAWPLLPKGHFVDRDVWAFHKDALLRIKAERLHSQVLAAFDFGATLPTIPWERMALSFVSLADFDVYLARLQNDIPKLPHGRDYQITTDLSTHNGRDRIGVLVKPHFWSRFEPRLPKEFVGTMPIYSGAGHRHWSYRQL